MAGDVLLLNALLMLAAWYLALGALGLVDGKSSPAGVTVLFLQSFVFLWAAAGRYFGGPIALPWVLAGGLVLLIFAAIAYALLQRQPREPSESERDLSQSGKLTDV